MPEACIRTWLLHLNRREFLSYFPRPWGPYFDRVSGDFLFISWVAEVSHVFVVQGFLPPPAVD